MTAIKIHINTQSQRMLIVSFVLGLLFFLVLSFKTATSDVKHYVVLNYSTYHQRFDIIDSEGEVEKRAYSEPETVTDQSAVLSLIRDYELKGYKLFDYEVDYVGKGKMVINAIMLR